MPVHGLDPALLKAPYPAHFDIEAVIRPNILTLHPYRCARDDYQEGILLDANENALGHSIPRAKGTVPDSAATVNGAAVMAPVPATDDSDVLDADLHRYPDPAQVEIKNLIADMRLPQLANLNSATGRPKKSDYVFLGVGSDEVIDLLMRVCCVPGRDRILTTPPTYGMYGVCAQVNDLGVTKVPLETNGGAFQLRVEEVKKACSADGNIKLIFLCSPGNPTGTLIRLEDIIAILECPDFKGIVIVDEAYIDFSGPETSAASLVTKYSNLCVMQTLSKSFGLAAIRLGVALAHPALIQILTNTKAPYNISTPSSLLALKALSPKGVAVMQSKIKTLLDSRGKLLRALTGPPFVELGVGSALGGNNANFILAPILDRSTKAPDNQRASRLYKCLAEEKGVVVRYRGSEVGCEGCLRITVGTAEENSVLLQKLEEALRAI